MAIYYVKTDGSDNYSGLSDTSAWASWRKAFSEASAGDTVYFKGGIYYSNGVNTAPVIAPYAFVPVGHSGTSDNLIRFFADPSDYITGNYPILDCSGQTSISSIVSGIRLVSCQYIHFKGLTIRNVFQQETSAKLGQGISIEYTANLTFENMTIHNVEGRGVGGEVLTGYYDATTTPVTIQCDNTRWINCDFYDLYDRYSASPGNAADGIKVTIDGRTDASYSMPYWYLYGCRTWNYSDDAFDIGGPGIVSFENCWVSSTTKYKDVSTSWNIEGNGFKEGGVFTPLLLSDVSAGFHWRQFHNCIAAHCVGRGFYDLDYAENYRTNGLYFNNIAYANEDSGFAGNSRYFDPSWNPDPNCPPRTTRYHNNIAWRNCPSSAYGPYWYEVELFREVYPESNNSWIETTTGAEWPGWAYNSDVSIKDADFLSLDSSELFSKPRKSDGSLPDVSFGHLTINSSLIYAGIFMQDCCIFDGEGKQWHNPPSIGAFEYTGINASTYSLPIVNTNSVTNISTISAYVSADVLYDGSTNNTYRGICWSTSLNPTVQDNSIRDVSVGEGTFSIYIPNLNSSTLYHVRSFSYNSEGIYYGADVSFYTINKQKNIIANHSIVDDYDKIPTYYINEVKKMWLSYPGESHALGILKGLDLLEASYGTYAVDTRYYTEGGDPTPYTDVSLRASTALWGKWLTPTGWWYEIGERDWWTNAEAISGVKAGLTWCNSIGLTLSAVCFGWCWDHTRGTASAGTDPLTQNHWYGQSLGSASGNLPWGIDASDNAASGNVVNMDTYLDATQQYIDYCTSMGYSTKVFFTTAPMDDVNGEFSAEELKEVLYQGNLKNEHIRSYVNSSTNLILFDYADILAYDYNNDVSTSTWNNNRYPTIAYTNAVYGYAHISYPGTVRLAKGIWWMLARIAGWDGETSYIPTVDTSSLSLIYTVSASCGGYVSSDGSASIIMAGVCISTNANPVVTDVSTKDVSTTGLFYSNLTSLNASTHYHVRAYAYNSVGIAYGTDVSFNTLPSADGSIYFVATDGSDSYTITQAKNIATPWATWQRAVTDASPGDVIYIRGGTYLPNKTLFGGTVGPIGMSFKPLENLGRNGTASKPISYYNYPGEVPILDCSLVTPVTNYLFGVSIEYTQYLNFRGLTVCNIRQDHYPVETTGFSTYGCANLRFENCVVHDVSGRGFYYDSGSWNSWDGGGAPFTSDHSYWINCDAYNLFDAIDITTSETPGNAADGWKIHGYQGNYLYFIGCRAWNYSDDGFDISGQAYKIFKNCWASSTSKYFVASINPSTGSHMEGNGFKIGAPNKYYFRPELLTDQVLVTITNCIAAECVASGIENNLFLGLPEYTSNKGHIYNNLAYKNYAGFGEGSDITPRIRYTIHKNNISFASDSSAYGAVPFYEVKIYRPAIYTESNNTWHPVNTSEGWPGWYYADPSASIGDFISLDVSELQRPRKSDGSLPDVSFGHLAAGSRLIGAGMNMGIATDSAGTSYKNPPSMGVFEYDGDSSAIVITTTIGAITDISSYSVVASGNVTHDGSIVLTYRGFCWSMKESPNIYDASVTDISTGEGVYNTHIFGLNSSTHYYIRAFACNSTGIGYSIDGSFNTLQSVIQKPTVTTTAISNIYSTSATGGGNITHDGDASTVYRGICWGTLDEYPNIMYGEDSSVLSETTSGEGSYTLSLSGLSASTHYYVRAFAYNAEGVAYGIDVSFNTLSSDISTSIPSVDTSSITNISTTSASCACIVTHDGSVALTYRGICVSTASSPTTLDVSVRDANTGEGTYIGSLTSLSPSTHYFVRAFAYNSVGTAYGINASFNTLDVSASIPTVNTSSMTDISINTAIANGIVVHDGSITLTYRGFCVSTASSPTTLDVSSRDTSTGEGSFNLTLTSLSSSTHYFVRAFAYNSIGTAYGSDVSFNTLSETATSAPTVTTSAISDISAYTATSGGNVTHDGSITLVYKGICWSTSASPTTLDASYLNASTGEGSYVSYLTALSASTHYFIRAFAYNSVGTAYGTDVSFNTLYVPVPPSVSTNVIYMRLSNSKVLTVDGKYLYI